MVLESRQFRGDLLDFEVATVSALVGESADFAGIVGRELDRYDAFLSRSLESV